MRLGASTIKYILLLLNFIFAVLGLILISLGIINILAAEKLDLNHDKNIVEAIFSAFFCSVVITIIGGIIITVGAIVLIFAIFGCWAAIRESKTKLLIYVSVLTVLVLVELALISFGTNSNQSNVSDEGDLSFEQLWLKENYRPGPLAELENFLQCCGVNSTEDYRKIGREIPNTCCKDQNCTLPENIYQEGCRSKYEEYMHNRFALFNIVTILMILLQITAFIFSWLLYRSLNNESRPLKDTDCKDATARHTMI